MAEVIVADTATMSAWGNPKASHSGAAPSVMSKYQAGWSNGSVGLVYMARKVNAHGGYFCFTILDTIWYANNGRWTQYRQPIGENCAWYCENGYAGENCASGVGNSCNLKTIANSDLQASQIQLTTGDIELQLRSDKGMFTYGYMSGGFEGDAILVASTFLGNGRGITAAPITFLAGAWDGVLNTTTATAMSAEIKASTSTIQKTLCAEGWSGTDCASPTEACTACPDNKVFIMSKMACSAGKLDAAHPGDKGYSCDGDRTRYMDGNGECAYKGYSSAANIATKCWKTLTSYDFNKCLRGGSTATPKSIPTAIIAAPVAATVAVAQTTSTL